MKKILLVSQLIFCLAFQGFTQSSNKNVSVTWGLKVKNSNKTVLNQIIGNQDNEIFVLKNNAFSSKLFFEKYKNDDLSLSKANIFSLKNSDNNENFEYIFFLNNELFLFTSYKENKVKKKTLIARIINKTTLAPKGEPIIIGEIDFEGKSKKNSGSFDYQISNDESKLLIYYQLPYDKGAKEKFGYIVYDNNLNKIWEKQTSLPYEDKQFNVENYKIDNSGNVYLLGVLSKDKRTSKRLGEPNYLYKIFSYQNLGQNTEEYDVKFGDKFITDMQFDINISNDLICAGFFSEEGNYSIKGAFYMSINHLSKQVMNKELKEFSFNELTLNMQEKDIKKTQRKIEKGKNIELYDYYLDDIIMRSDGGALLIAEQYRVDVFRTPITDAQGYTTYTNTYIYNYNDILVVNISPNGEIDWVHKIAKRQRTSNDNGFFSSYAKIIKDDKICFIFNDNIANIGNSNNKSIYSFNKSKKRSAACVVELKSDGSQTRTALFNQKEAQVMIRPLISGIINDNEMILFGFWGNKQQIAKLTFN